MELYQLVPPPIKREVPVVQELKSQEPVPVYEPPTASPSALAEYIIEGEKPRERYFLHDSTMPIKLHTDGTIVLGLTLDNKLNRANQERFAQDRNTLTREVQLYHSPVQEQVTASAIAVAMNEVPKELKLAYNEKLAEYKDVSARLTRHKYMSPTVLELTTERFTQLITDLSDILGQVDAIREHTLEESQEGFAI